MPVSNNATETMQVSILNPHKKFLMYTIENVVDKVVITMKSAKFYSERRHSKTHGGLANFSSLAYDCV